MVYSTRWQKKVDWCKNNHAGHFYEQQLQMYERLFIFLKYTNIKIGIKIHIMFGLLIDSFSNDNKFQISNFYL